ncbi:MAG: EscF/YscF/HrpA family type III secretion system needle major subunit [Burkholderiales bacterium]|nr:EscF/YscF/HrpA family type III secretion system needle major subunit [Burkholderiales bacterium]
MSIYVPTVGSYFDMSQVFATVGGSIESLESQMLTSIQALGNNPTPEQLAQYQYLTIQWQTQVSMLTNSIKSYGDTQKQVAQNIGS